MQEEPLLPCSSGKPEDKANATNSVRSAYNSCSSNSNSKICQNKNKNDLSRTSTSAATTRQKFSRQVKKLSFDLETFRHISKRRIFTTSRSWSVELKDSDDLSKLKFSRRGRTLSNKISKSFSLNFRKSLTLENSYAASFEKPSSSR